MSKNSDIGLNGDWKPGTRSLARMLASVGWYQDLVRASGGLCAICKKPPLDGAALGLDHHHGCCGSENACKACARGLLCRPCNLGLGSFRDDPANLRAAADYLDSYEFNRPEGPRQPDLASSTANRIGVDRRALAKANQQRGEAEWAKQHAEREAERQARVSEREAERQARAAEREAKRRAKEAERASMGEGIAPDDPRHGSVNAYGNLKCRCQACTEAWTAYARARTALKRAAAASAGASPIDQPSVTQRQTLF